MSEIIKLLDSRFVTDRDVRVTRALVSLDEYSQLKQRITELEQQLKTAQASGVRLAAENCMAFKAFDDHRFFIDRQDLYEFAYKIELGYANNLEGK